MKGNNFLSGRVLLNIINAQTDNFVELSILSGLRRETDFKKKRLESVAFFDCNLSKFNFSGSQLFFCDFKESRIADADFSNAIFCGCDPRDATDWQQWLKRNDKSAILRGRAILIEADDILADFDFDTPWKVQKKFILNRKDVINADDAVDVPLVYLDEIFSNEAHSRDRAVTPKNYEKGTKVTGIVRDIDNEGVVVTLPNQSKGFIKAKRGTKYGELGHPGAHYIIGSEIEVTVGTDSELKLLLDNQLYGPESSLIDLQNAIIEQKKKLNHLSREHTPLEWAKVQVEVADLLSALGKSGHQQSGVGAALSAYNLALEVVDVETLPGLWARIQIGIGYVHAMTGSRNRHSTIDAIIAFENGLSMMESLRGSREYAEAKLSLAYSLSAQAHQWKGNRKDWSLAIETALDVLDSIVGTNYADIWTEANLLLGSLYFYLAKQEQNENAYQISLRHKFSVRKMLKNNRVYRSGISYNTNSNNNNSIREVWRSYRKLRKYLNEN